MSGMQGYWAKIGLKAGLIFVVGFAIISTFRSTKRKVVRVVEGTGDVTIPLAFVPFTFDGERLGTFRKLVIHRAGPDEPSGVDVTIRITDRAQLGRLAGCEVTVDDPTRINEHTTFRCVQAADSGLEGFGSLVIQTKDGQGRWVDAERLTIKIPSQVAERIRGTADPAAEVIEAESGRFSEIGDSLGALGAALATAASDSARAEIHERMSELRDQMAEVQRAVQAAAQSKARSARHRAAVAGHEVPAKPAPPPKP
ncbi:MAG: hypothetical protein FJ206_12935 [Gemmatimonadetes bacterium]|nr:hypothetical protein [Gemmatimonadota bacterium]